MYTKDMPKFINPFTDIGFKRPFTDIGFKRIFGQEINKDLLIDFLNALLEGEKRVTDITFLDKEQIPLYEEDRMLIYDIYCTDQNGEQFIVEMQNKGQIHFRERALYYLSQAVASSRRPSPGRESAGWTGGSTSRPSTACSS